MIRAFLIAIVVLVTLPSVVRAGDDATVALNFQDVELPVLAHFVSEVTGRNFIVDERVRGKVTIISPTRLTPDEAYLVFQSVLQVKGFSTVASGAVTKIVPARDARESAGPSRQSSDEVVTRLVPLVHADAAALLPVLQPLVSKDGVLSVYPPTNHLLVVDAGANVERVARTAAELDRPATERSVETLSLRWAGAEELAARLRDAMGADASGHGPRVVAEPRTNALIVAGTPDDIRRARAVVASLDNRPTPGTSTVHVHRLQYADADGMVRVLAQLLGLPPPPPPTPREHGSSLQRSAAAHAAAALGYDGSMGEASPPAPERTSSAATPAGTGGTASIPLEAPVRLTADPATNSIVVSATAQDWATLRRVIEELDVRRRQVFVEAILLEATTDKTQRLGIEFAASGSLGDKASGLAVGNLNALSGALRNPTSLPGLILAAASNQTVRLPGGEEVPAQTVLLTALQEDTELNILSAPNLVTTDNEEAEIVVGRNVPFIASRATSSSNLSNLFTTIERRDVGITLRLTPQVTADDYVRLTIFEEVSDIDPQVVAAVGDPAEVGPTTTIRSASTVIAARDGQTVVIGGLLGDAIRNHERSVPFLRDVPVLGHLFRSNDARRARTNLLVFLTPHVITTDTQARETADEQRDRMPRSVRGSPALRGRGWKEPASP